MKKILGSFMALVMLLGCSSQSQETQNSDTQNQTAVAQNGDYVNIDFVGKIDGVAFNGGSAEGYELKLGSDTMIDGFEDGIVGIYDDGFADPLVFKRFIGYGINSFICKPEAVPIVRLCAAQTVLPEN